MASDYQITNYANYKMPVPVWLKVLNAEVIACTRCPRLVVYREQIAREKRRAYRDHEYWGKPVPGFGDPHARVLVLGLAPGAHGSNRTGRPFTGDASGKFMYPVLYEAGFANQPTATDRRRRAGFDRSLHHRRRPLRAARQQAFAPGTGQLRSVSGARTRRTERSTRNRCPGQNRVRGLSQLPEAKKADRGQREYEFRHGAEYVLPDGCVLLASYHPSNQNTQTGKLTKEMFQRIFKRARELADECHRGGFRGNGHLWAGMGAPSLRDGPPLFLLRRDRDFAPSSVRRAQIAVGHLRF
jgi:uracil-DNA glycosylase